MTIVRPDVARKKDVDEDVGGTKVRARERTSRRGTSRARGLAQARDVVPRVPFFFLIPGAARTRAK